MTTREIVDETFGLGRQDYTLTRIYSVPQHPGNGAPTYLVRVTVKWDSYEQQSYARAEAFSAPQMAWTTLVTAPTSDWYRAAPSFYAPVKPGPGALAPVAEDLIRRATTVLGALQPAAGDDDPDEDAYLDAREAAHDDAAAAADRALTGGAHAG